MVREKFSDSEISREAKKWCVCVPLLIESPHPLQVFIFDHLELDMTQFVSFQGGGQLSLHEAAVAHDDQICEFCGRQTHQHMLLLSF